MTATLRAVASAVASGVTITCNKPTGTVAGDLLLGFQTADRGTTTDMATPTGGASWSLLASQLFVTGELGTRIWWKIAGSSEPSTYGFSQVSSADGVVAVAAVITPVTTAPVFASSAATASATSIPTPSITPTGADDLEFRWAASQGQGGATLTWTSPATYTEQVDRQSGTFTSASLAAKTLSSSAATGVQNFTISAATTAYIGFTVAVAGTAPPLPPRPIMIGQPAVQRAAFI